MNRPQTEILVHIAAPARAADDSRYRALAAAYLDFEPTSRIPIITFGSSATGDTEPGSADDGERAAAARTSTEVEDAPQSTPNFGVIESPLLSFRSAINNLDSPLPRDASQDDISESQLSWRPPPSVVQDSMPDNNLALSQYCTPTRVLSHYTSALDSSQSEFSPFPHPRHPGTPSHQRGCAGVDGESQQRQQQQSPGEASTVIPLSPGAGTKRRLPSSPTPTPTSTPVVDETRISSSYPSQQDEPAPSPHAGSEPPLSKRPRTSPDPAEPGTPLARSASDMGPRRQRQQERQQDQKQSSPPPHTTTAATATRTITTTSAPPEMPDTLEILSPPPATGQAWLRPEDVITEVLAKLARELDLGRRFQPERQTRPLRPFERGYWRVDCGGWGPALRRDAWAFLADYVGRRGAAGWGVSVRRDAAFERLRLYCWGCAVGHMYLVLYLVSRRQVLYSGMEWIAADGEAVVVMGKRPPPGPGSRGRSRT